VRVILVFLTLAFVLLAFRAIMFAGLRPIKSLRSKSGNFRHVGRDPPSLTLSAPAHYRHARR
jgi:hypothetical protein